MFIQNTCLGVLCLNVVDH